MILTFFPLGRKVHDRMEVNVLLELVINELLSIFCHCWTESSVRNRDVCFGTVESKHQARPVKIIDG